MVERTSRWPLVGRDEELAAFAEAWASRRCRGLVIVGAAGVGKTRLADEYMAQAVRQGWAGGRATASAAAGAVPLGAIAHLIPAGVDMSDPATGFAQVATALGGPQRHRRVLQVDDLHLLDAASAILLGQLLDAGVIRLIATVRTGTTPVEAVNGLVGADRLLRVDLAPFDQDMVEQVLEAVLGGPVSRRAVHTLYEASGGNALYLHELVHGAQTSGALSRTDGVWDLSEGALAGTPRLTELITARLDTATPAARPVLELLALCEPLSLGDSGPMAVLAELEAAGLIRVHLDGRRTAVALTHPLYGETLRTDMPVLRRRALLLQQIERVEAHGARRRDDTQHLAGWSLAATGHADPALLVRAASLARHADDYSRATVLAGAAWREERSIRTALTYATTLIDLARHDEAEGVLREAEELSPDSGQVLLDARLDNLILQGRLLDAQRLLEDREDPQSRLSMATVLYYRGRFLDSLGFCRPLLESSDATTRQDARTCAASCLLRIGSIDEATDMLRPLQRFLPYAEDRDGERANSLYSDFIENIDAYAHGLSGELHAAEEILTRSYEEAVVRSETGARSAVGLGFILLERGRPRTAMSMLHPVATQRTHWDLFTQWAQANAVICAAVLQQKESMDRYLALLPEPGDNVEACNNRLARAWYASVTFDKSRAEQMLREAAGESRRLEQHLHTVWVVHTMGRLGMAELAAPYWDVPVQGAFLRAQLDYTRAVAGDDAERLTQVAQVFRTAGADLYAAEAYAGAAQAHRRRGHTRRAKVAANWAAEAAANCEGAHTPALDFLRATQTMVHLTDREREIALFAAGGAASKEIATALCLSVRTVNNHLQHVYTKLGVSNRRELSENIGLVRRSPVAADRSAS